MSRVDTKKLTDNEITKALECHAHKHECTGCPLEKYGFGCTEMLANQALSLIKRQQERITILESGVMTTKAWEDIMRNALSPLVAKIAEDKEKEMVGDNNG